MNLTVSPRQERLAPDPMCYSHPPKLNRPHPQLTQQPPNWQTTNHFYTIHQSTTSIRRDPNTTLIRHDHIWRASQVNDHASTKTLTPRHGKPRTVTLTQIKISNLRLHNTTMFRSLLQRMRSTKLRSYHCTAGKKNLSSFTLTSTSLKQKVHITTSSPCIRLTDITPRLHHVSTSVHVTRTSIQIATLQQVSPVTF